jgi:hypothetical protein
MGNPSAVLHPRPTTGNDADIVLGNRHILKGKYWKNFLEHKSHLVVLVIKSRILALFDDYVVCKITE